MAALFVFGLVAVAVLGCERANEQRAEDETAALESAATTGDGQLPTEEVSAKPGVERDNALTHADPNDFWNGLERQSIQLEQTLLVVKGSKGVIACPYLDIETFNATGEPCAIVPAADFDGMPESQVTAVSDSAKQLGITVGMSGREALDRIR